MKKLLMLLLFLIVGIIAKSQDRDTAYYRSTRQTLYKGDSAMEKQDTFLITLMKTSETQKFLLLKARGVTDKFVVGPALGAETVDGTLLIYISLSATSPPFPQSVLCLALKEGEIYMIGLRTDIYTIIFDVYRENQL